MQYLHALIILPLEHLIDEMEKTHIENYIHLKKYIYINYFEVSQNRNHDIPFKIELILRIQIFLNFYFHKNERSNHLTSAPSVQAILRLTYIILMTDH